MVEYRKAHPEERRQYIDFANMVFNGAGDDVEFESVLPKVYGPDVECSALQNIAYDDEKGIRALVAALPGTLHVGGEALKTSFIGTVSVHPEARGEGHMKKLMAVALDEMKATGVDLAMLHGRRRRYEYFGYVQAGQVHRCSIYDFTVQHVLGQLDVSDVAFEELTPDSPWLGLAKAAHDAQPVHYERPAEDFLTISRSFLQRPWVILRGGQFAGLLLCHAKHPENVSELICAVGDIDAAVKAWMTSRELHHLSITVSPWAAAQLKHLALYADHISSSHSLQVRILNYARVASALLTAKAQTSRLADGVLALDADGEQFTIIVKNNKVTVVPGAEDPICLSGNEAVMLMMYPYEYEGRPATPAGWFPLPVHCSEADSF